MISGATYQGAHEWQLLERYERVIMGIQYPQMMITVRFVMKSTAYGPADCRLTRSGSYRSFTVRVPGKQGKKEWGY